MIHFEVYQTTGDRFCFNVLGGNGRMLMQAVHDYPSKSACLAAIDRITTAELDMTEVFENGLRTHSIEPREKPCPHCKNFPYLTATKMTIKPTGEEWIRVRK